MKHLVQSNLIHCVVGVAKNSPLISDSAAQHLYALLSDTAERAGAHQLAVGGCDDHIHILLSLPPTLAPAELVDEMRLISQKSLTSKLQSRRPFQWDAGYTTFSVGVSQLRGTIEYINNQPDFHRRISFSEEMALFDEAHDNAFAPQVCAD